MKRPLATTLTIFAFLFSVPHALFRVSPQQTSNHEANTKAVQARVHDTVTVRRDDRGIPYIEAKNDEDLYFAQGYITASDRLWQMDLWRRIIRGELAEILGQPALSQDKHHRTLGFARIIDNTAARLAPDMRAVLGAYAKGVNAFIESRTSQN